MDRISADEAMQMLGCDVDTINTYIGNGTLRAEEDADGSVFISREDVVNLMDGSSQLDLLESDDGTIILAGDSDELQIDLNDIDDDAMTVVNSGVTAHNLVTLAQLPLMTMNSKLPISVTKWKKVICRLMKQMSRKTSASQMTIST